MGFPCKGCGACRAPGPTPYSSAASLVEEEQTPELGVAGIPLDADRRSDPVRPVGRNYRIDPLLRRRGDEPPDTVDLLPIHAGHRRSRLLGREHGVEADQIHADPGEEPDVKRDLGGWSLVGLRPSCPEAYRRAVAQGKPVAIAGKLDEPGLPGLLFIEISQIEQGPRGCPMMGIIESPGPDNRSGRLNFLRLRGRNQCHHQEDEGAPRDPWSPKDPPEIGL